MAPKFESGMFVRTPAWHNQGNLINAYPENFEQARTLASLDWDVYDRPVYDVEVGDNGYIVPTVVPGWRSIRRDDTDELLTIQRDSYTLVTMGEFGQVIEYVMGADIKGMPKVNYDALVSLDGGRSVVATMWLDRPFTIPGDESETYPYIVAMNRYDGRGGLQIGPNAVRVVCANTQQLAEGEWAGKVPSFTIRHTKNWAERTEEARQFLVASLATMQAWEEMAQHLAKSSAGLDDVQGYVKKWLPFSDDMSEQTRANVQAKRDAFFTAYSSATCESITGTWWGVLQASIEAAEHLFPYRNEDTKARRALEYFKDSPKARAHRLVVKAAS